MCVSVRVCVNVCAWLASPSLPSLHVPSVRIADTHLKGNGCAVDGGESGEGPGRSRGRGGWHRVYCMRRIKKASTLLTSCLSSHLLPFLRNTHFCLPSDTP